MADEFTIRELLGLSSMALVLASPIVAFVVIVMRAMGRDHLETMEFYRRRGERRQADRARRATSGKPGCGPAGPGDAWHRDSSANAGEKNFTDLAK